MSLYIHWNLNPEIINIFGYSLRYYGIVFTGGLVLCHWILRWIFRKENISLEKLDLLTFYSIIGIFAGARLGHCLFYNPEYYLSHPLEMLLPIEVGENGSVSFVGYLGLASHGGALGLIAALALYARKTGESLLNTVDLIAVVTPLGSTFIRLANLTNSEMIGHPTDVPWAFVFEQIDDVPRHPAQLYEAICYLLIFVFLIYLYVKHRSRLQHGMFFGLCITLIFIARFLIEFVKINQVDFENNMALNMGQLLSIPFILVGLGFIVRSNSKHLKRL